MTDRIYIFVTLYCNCCDCHYFWPIITQTNHSHWSLVVFEQAETSEKSVSEKYIVMNLNAAQKLLNNSYPFIGGLQVTTLAEVLAFKVEKGEFVQVLNVDNSHWITCSTVGCKPGEVNVFDSMLGHDLPDRTRNRLQEVPKFQKRSIFFYTGEVCVVMSNLNLFDFFSKLFLDEKVRNAVAIS